MVMENMAQLHISTDPALLDVTLIHQFLSERSTWALGIPRATVERGKGVSKALVAAVLAHPELQGLRRFMLATSDAHALYARYGFTPPARPATLMERYFPNIYTN